MDIRTVSKLMKINSTITISHARDIEKLIYNYNVNHGFIIVKDKIKKTLKKKPKKTQIIMKRRD